MFVRLKKEIFLRGWKNIPYSLYSFKNSSAPYKITKEQSGILSGAVLYEKGTFLDMLMNIGYLEECSEYDKITDNQKYKRYDNLYFNSVIFSITGKCNYRCRHCSVSAPDAAMGEMTFEQIEKLIVQFKECGLKNITLIGGEPLVHPDFMRIVDRIISEGIIVSSVYTNGSLINEKLLDDFEQRGIKPGFQISYDGYGFHDKMRGVKGAEKSFFKALKLLKSRNYHVSCAMSITKDSISSLSDTVDILTENGVSLLTAYPPFDCGNWKKVSDADKLTFEELLEEYIRYIPLYIEADFPLTLNLYRIAYFSREKRKYLIIPKSVIKNKNPSECYACRTFNSELDISPDGYLSPCYAIMDTAFVKENMPNILETSFVDAITDSAFTRSVELTVEDIFNENEKCSECKYKTECGGGCRSSALISDNDFMGYDRAMCYAFENGYIDRLRNAVKEGYARRNEKLKGSILYE